MVKRKLQRAVTGLDVGATGARAVQLRQCGSDYVVDRAIKQEWKSSETQQDAAEVDAMRLKRLAGFVRSANLRKRGVVVELNPPAVECHPLEVPASVIESEPAKMSELVNWEIQRLLGEEAESVETRHWSLPKTKVPSPTVMGVAARSDAVANVVSLCDASGVDCHAVEPAALALARFGALLCDWDADDVWGVLDLGATETRLVLCVEGVPTVVRRAGAGGQAWTLQIAESLELGLKAAEIQKREQGIASIRRDTAASEGLGREVPSILLGALRNQLRDVASEVKRSYEYALSCYPGRNAGDLILVGGGAAMKNFPEFLEAALDIRVTRASEYLGRERCRLSFDAGKPEELGEFAVAVGLGIEA